MYSDTETNILNQTQMIITDEVRVLIVTDYYVASFLGIGRATNYISLANMSNNEAVFDVMYNKCNNHNNGPTLLLYLDMNNGVHFLRSGFAKCSNTNIINRINTKYLLK